jgi:hypothetical protein
MKAEAYLVFEQGTAIPLRLAHLLEEAIVLTQRYESSEYQYELGKKTTPGLTVLNKDYVAAMLVSEKLK